MKPDSTTRLSHGARLSSEVRSSSSRSSSRSRRARTDTTPMTSRAHATTPNVHSRRSVLRAIGLSIGSQAVADAPDGVDQLVLTSVELLAEIADVVLDDTRVAVEI